MCQKCLLPFLVVIGVLMPALAATDTPVALQVVPPAAIAVQCQAVMDLIRRRQPAVADRFLVESIPREGQREVFEVDGVQDRIRIRGSSGVAMAAGWHWYLKHVCYQHMSWCGSRMDMAAQDIRPVPSGRFRQVLPHQHVVYMNYCTLSYSMPWWDWARWEQEIDFMALNGVTMPLAMTGLEGVWYHALLRQGLTDEEARTFLVGPAYFAWQWMANIDSHGGPLPKSWIESHIALGRRIIDRQRQLGMTPIQQGFSGHVPGIFKARFPQAKILQKTSWCGFPGAWQLDPVDPLFAGFGRIFLEEQSRLFGLGGFYAADPFHESAPPQSDTAYLDQVGKAIHALFDRADPGSTWVMQSWSIRKDIACAVPKGRLLVVDLAGSGWMKNDGFWGHRFIVGQLHNFGGRVNLHGDIANILANPFMSAKKTYPDTAQGMGIFMEGIVQNPVFYDAVFDMVVSDRPEAPEAWLRGYAHRRYGVASASADQAWELLRNGPYRSGTSGVESSSIIAARPALDVKKSGPNAGFSMPYKPTALIQAWDLLVAGQREGAGGDAYRFDVMDLGRQVLSNLGQELQRDVRLAFEAGNRPAFLAAGARFIDLLRDVDRLLETRVEYRFGDWLASARAWGTTQAERDLYDRNASMLITIWGPEQKPSIFDYGWREWSGLIRCYYLPRWQLFFEQMDAVLAAGGNHYSEDKLAKSYGREAWEANEVYQRLATWELSWILSPKGAWKPLPTEDSLLVAADLRRKWDAALVQAYGSERAALIAADEQRKSENRIGGRKIWEWSPASTPAAWTEVDIPASDSIKDEGVYEVAFISLARKKDLQVAWVALTQDGREVVRDARQGRSAAVLLDVNTWRIPLDAVAFGARYGIRISIRGLNGTESGGMMTIRKAAKQSGR